MKFCPYCGEELIDDAKFCKRCGSSISAGATRPQFNSGQPAEKSYTITLVVGYIAAILIPIIGIIIGIYLMTRKDSPDAKHGKFIIIVAAAVWILSFLSLNIFY